ncbi:hypothetical protein FRB94_000550 [Tulasnella sp. JGI-2019a]|nr:hypothetical protein FRB94_000550 [Tulasnella sp. JGI-2019a]KAG9016144.1 hypothetical protein FRB93_011618 [Tulasnella sp. JGI-2019a]
MAQALETRHKRSRSATHRSSSQWDLSSRRICTPTTITKLSVALSPTQQHVSGAEHAPRRTSLPAGLKVARSSSQARVTPTGPSTARPTIKKRRATMVTPRTAAMCLAFEGVSIAYDGEDTEGSSSSGGGILMQEENLQAALSPYLRETVAESSSSGSSAFFTSGHTPNPAQFQAKAIPVAYMGEPRLQTSPISTSPSTSTSDLARLPPSPIPSFPPYTPKETPDNHLVSIGPPAEDQTTTVAIVNSTQAPLDHTDPAFFIVPSTCDKRRRDAIGGGASEFMDGPMGPRPIKKLKKANGKAIAPRLSTSSLPELIMPTAIDVVDFITRRGGTCYEGDVFMRFRTGESEHVRSVVNEIIQVFAKVDVGNDGSRWVTLAPGVTA